MCTELPLLLRRTDSGFPDVLDLQISGLHCETCQRHPPSPRLQRSSSLFKKHSEYESYFVKLNAGWGTYVVEFKISGSRPIKTAGSAEVSNSSRGPFKNGRSSALPDSAGRLLRRMLPHRSVAGFSFLSSER